MTLLGIIDPETPLTADRLIVGDIAVYRKPDGVKVRHRIVDIGEDDQGKYWRFKGDNPITNWRKDKIVVRVDMLKYVVQAIFYGKNDRPGVKELVKEVAMNWGMLLKWLQQLLPTLLTLGANWLLKNEKAQRVLKETQEAAETNAMVAANLAGYVADGKITAEEIQAALKDLGAARKENMEVVEAIKCLIGKCS